MSSNTEDRLDGIRGQLAGLLEAVDPLEHPQAVTAVAMALDELVHPAEPPPEWAAEARADSDRVLSDVYDELIRAIDEPTPVVHPLALANAARLVDEARLALAADRSRRP